ncbi:glycosyltransferase involved in cell wall biosynthesis [Pseudosporangium ferrugineum]|uniref:Glycosyltransferase involved in cell wall biosynthesis n=2 Tax=Pseudosporangium ferrugineum TaxID=439699 RepID=A0A2T0RDU0_9ACTN|nr:glycosyltransferase involved in cell wall biosynthesis [Pseudosporangium ferrugineum]
MTVRVKLVSPLPPPAGGIARWTALVMRYARSQSTIRISLLNTALRLRSVTQTSPLARISAGIPQILRCTFSLAQGLARRQVDVVHINCSGQFGIARDLVLATLARLFRVPVVIHIRFGRVPVVLKSDGYEGLLLRRLLAKVNATIAIDSKTANALREHCPGLPVSLIPNCIDTPDWSPRAESEEFGKYVLFAGWLIRAKGIEELLAAWRELHIDGWNLVLAGTYDVAYLDALGLRPGTDSTITVLGEVEHERLMSLMAGCEIFVLPSHTEGFPNSVLEAMSLGRAVIACDVGAIGDMLSEDCGVTVPPRDSAKLGQSIAVLMADSDMRAKLGANAALRAKTLYSLPAVFDQYRALWEHLADRHY